MQVLKERGLGEKIEDNPFKSVEEWLKQDHAEILKVR